MRSGGCRLRFRSSCAFHGGYDRAAHIAFADQEQKSVIVCFQNRLVAESVCFGIIHLDRRLHRRDIRFVYRILHAFLLCVVPVLPSLKTKYANVVDVFEVSLRSDVRIEHSDHLFRHSEREDEKIVGIFVVAVNEHHIPKVSERARGIDYAVKIRRGLCGGSGIRRSACIGCALLGCRGAFGNNSVTGLSARGENKHKYKRKNKNFFHCKLPTFTKI